MNSPRPTKLSADHRLCKYVPFARMRLSDPNALRLKPELWAVFEAVCKRQAMQPGQLIDLAAAGEAAGSSAAQRAGALRAFLVNFDNSGCRDRE